MTLFVIGFDILPGFDFTNRSSQYRNIVFRMFFLFFSYAVYWMWMVSSKSQTLPYFARSKTSGVCWSFVSV